MIAGLLLIPFVNLQFPPSAFAETVPPTLQVANVDDSTDDPSDTTPPSVAAVAVNGSTLTLTYDENLDSSSTPANPDFNVTVDGAPVSVTNVAVAGTMVTLTLADTVNAGDPVSVTYNVGTNPIQDAAGNAATALTGQAVTNNTVPPADTTAPTFVSAAVNGKVLTLTYNEPLDPASTPESSHFIVKHGWNLEFAGTVAVRNVVVADTTVTLTLASAVSQSFGVWVTYTSGANPIQDMAGNAAASLTETVVTNHTPPDTTPPQLEEAKVNGSTLTLCFDEYVYFDYSIASAFTVTYGTVPQEIAATSLSYVYCTAHPDPWGHSVSLTLASPVPHGETLVLLSYSNPGDFSGLTDQFGNRVPSFSGYPVTNRTPVSLSAAIADGDTVTLTYTGNLDETSVPAPNAFSVRRANYGWSANPKSVSISGNSVVLTLPHRIVAGEELILNYSSGANPVKDTTGTPVNSITSRAVTNNTPAGSDTTPPALTSGIVNRDTVVLTFSEPLNDGVNVPVAAVEIRTSTDERLTVSTVEVAGSTVTITLSTSVFPGQNFTFSYSPGVTNGNLLEDLSGNDVARISRHQLTNITDLTPPVFQSGTVNGTTMTLLYDEDLAPASVPAPDDFTVTVAGDPVEVSSVSLSGSTVTLTLASPAIDKAVVTITYNVGEYPLQDASGNVVTNLTGLAVENTTDTIGPALLHAVVGGATLVLTYDEDPVQSNVPAATDYEVTVNGNPVVVSSVALQGARVTLTLAAPVTAGATVTLSYTPGTAPLRDAVGNNADALVNQVVTNITGAVLHVGPNQPFTTLESAVAVAASSSTIIVHEGTYTLQQPLVVTQSNLTIRAADGTDAPIVDLQTYAGIIIDAPNVTVQGLHLIGGGLAIVITESAFGATVQGNTIDDSDQGVYVGGDFTGALTISGNHMHDTDYGISLDSVTNATVTITNNKVTNSLSRGIYIGAVGGNTPDRNVVQITGNSVTADGLQQSWTHGIYVREVDWEAHILIEGNNVSGYRHGVVLEYLGQEADDYVDQEGYVAPVVEVLNNTITDNYRGIYKYDDWTNGVLVTISGNTVQGNESGFYSAYGLDAYLRLTDNRFTNNVVGIHMDEDSILAHGTLLIDQNTITANDFVGLYFDSETEDGAQVRVTGNIITDNGDDFESAGLYLGSYSQDVTVAHNLFKGNAGPDIILRGQNHQIRANTFEMGPVDVPAVAIDSDATGSRIAYNQFLGGRVGIFNTGEESVDATLNWWGAQSGLGESPASQVIGDVNVSPWISGLTWSPVSLSLTQGTSRIAAATFVTLTSDSTTGSEPVDFSLWPLSSSASAVATVASNGTVRGVSAGAAKVSTGLTFDPGLAVTVKVPNTGGDSGGGGSPAPMPAPYVTISAAATETRETTVRVSGTSNPGAAVSVGGTTVIASAGGSWSAEVVLVEGTNIITATNGSASQSVTVIRDTVPPVVTLTADMTETTADTVVLTATTEAGATLAIHGQNVGIGSGSLTVKLAIGSNTFTATAKDKVGNEGSATITVVRTEVTDPGQGDGNLPETAQPEPEPVPVPVQLTDIEEHWAEAAIARLVQLGVITGFEDNTFRPDLTVNRVEFTTLLARALGLEGTTDLSRFTDADNIPDWARAHVAAAAAAGIVNGRAGGNFDPQATITRAEAAVMLANALKYLGIIAEGEGHSLSDSTAIPDWAQASVQAAVSSRLINGYEDGTFRPAALATRAEAAVMLIRLLDAR